MQESLKVVEIVRLEVLAKEYNENFDDSLRAPGWIVRLEDRTYIFVPYGLGYAPEIGDVLAFSRAKGEKFFPSELSVDGKLVWNLAPDKYEAELEKQKSLGRRFLSGELNAVESVPESDSAEAQSRVRARIMDWISSGRERLMTEVEAMEEPFRKRMLDFLGRGGEAWGMLFGETERFAVAEAAKIARFGDVALEILKAEEEGLLSPFQVARRFGLDTQRHTIDTYNSARLLAEVALRAPERVPNVHGTLCDVVGCNSYHCWSETAEAAASREEYLRNTKAYIMGNYLVAAESPEQALDLSEEIDFDGQPEEIPLSFPVGGDSSAEFLIRTGFSRGAMLPFVFAKAALPRDEYNTKPPEVH